MTKLVNPPDPPANQALEVVLRDSLEALHGFARKHTSNDQLAADAVQESVLRAIKAADRLEHGGNLRAWLYRILRNVLTDLHRREASRERAMVRFAHQPERDLAPDEETTACQCFKALLPALKPEYSDVVRRVDLEGQQLADVAEALGISRGNLNVRLHRGRRQLRERLEQTCRMCASHGCLDCTCNDHPPR